MKYIESIAITALILIVMYIAFALMVAAIHDLPVVADIHITEGG